MLSIMDAAARAIGVAVARAGRGEDAVVTDTFRLIYRKSSPQAETLRELAGARPFVRSGAATSSLLDETEAPKRCARVRQRTRISAIVREGPSGAGDSDPEAPSPVSLLALLLAPKG